MSPYPTNAPAGWSRFAPLILRIAVGAHLVQGTWDNVVSWARMLEFRDFLITEGFPVPLLCAIVSVAAQFLGGLALIAGAFTRWAAALMVVNFTVALLGVHLGDPYSAWFPAWMMWCGSLALFCSGAGAWSVDSWRENRW